MKIAIATEDHLKVSRHFGRAPYYVVCSFDDGKLTAKEVRHKSCHQRGSCADTGPCAATSAGMGDNSTHRHMASAIGDCQAVVCGGMGYGAYYDLQAAGLDVCVTEAVSIDEVIRKFPAGELVHCPDRIHR